MDDGPRRTVQLLREGWPDRPAMGPAISRALLDGVADGRLGETVRLSRPGRVVAFGRQDVVSPRYPEAVAAARAAGYEAMERLAGGRAALYFEGALSLTHTVPDPEPAKRTRARFAEMCDLLCEAFKSLGVDARIGEVPGEYCPGDYSVNAGGRVKLAGVGQRMIRGGAHIGVVIVVRDSAEARRVLTPVYEALGLEWRPETTGAVLEETSSDPIPRLGKVAGADGSRLGSDRADAERNDAGMRLVEDAILKAFARRFELVPAEVDAETLRHAEDIAAKYRSPSA